MITIPHSWLPIRARCRIFFSPGAYTQPSLQSTAEATLRIQGQPVTASVLSPDAFYPQIDQFFCVGQWQATTLVDELDIPHDKVFATGNAIFPENFQALPLEERKSAIIYSATPFPGLEHLPEMYRKLKADHPGLQFDVCSGMGVYGQTAE